MQKISYLGWGILLFALILSGCGKLERGGTPPDNMDPEVFFTNIPPEGDSVSVSPRIYWYGTDKDGYITAYQYAIIRDSVIDLWGDLSAAKDSLKIGSDDSTSWVDNAIRLDVFGAHIPALKGHQRNMRMYAEMDPKDYTPQHVFLRAVDNMGDISEIKTRMFWRNNHTPQCSIEVDSTFGLINFYCLPEITQTWKGIFISWVGLDILDYPDKRKQPDFYFRWELWGPYDTSEVDDPYDSTKKVASSLDSVEIGGEWYLDEWTLDKFHIFKNLENYPDSGYGWYHLRVWSRDDAFVSSDSATTFFRILKPLFRYDGDSTILVLDQTIYGGDGAANALTDVQPFYDTTLSRINDLCDNYKLIYLLGDEIPSEDSLSRYDLVIVLNLGRMGGICEDSYLKYKNYMDVGGRLWIIGLNNHGEWSGRGIHYFPNAYEVAIAYLGLEGVFYPEYSPAEPDKLEFIGAEPFGSWGLPFLEKDPVKVAKLKGYEKFPADGIPHVCYIVISTTLDFDKRAPFQRRLYSFISRRGLNSKMHLMPCATTYIGPTFRTAEFTFPLNLMKDGDETNPGAHEAFRKMVEWFWEDLPEP